MQEQATELEGLELLETSLPLDAEQPTERPKRRRYQRKDRDTPEDETRSSGTPDDKPRRRYVPKSHPEKIIEREAESYEAQLAAMFLLFGGATSMLLPVTGTAMVVRAQQGAAAVVEAAKANPRIAEALIALLKVGHYGPLVMFGMTLLTAATVDMGVTPPLSPPAQMMLSDVLERMGVQMQPTTAASNGHAAQASESSHV